MRTIQAKSPLVRTEGEVNGRMKESFLLPEVVADCQ